MRPIPIRARLTAWYGLVLAVLLTALGTFVVTQLRADLTAQVDRNLGQSAAQIADGYQSEGPAELTEASLEFLGGGDARASGAQVLDEAGRVVTFAGDASLSAPMLDATETRQVITGGTRVASYRHGAERRHLRAVAIPVRIAGRAQVVVAADSLRDVDEAVARVRVLIVTGGLAALGLALAGGWWIARKGLRPVEQMATRAADIDAADLSQRVPVPAAHDELRHLAQTLNQMLARLERGVAARERLVADASHELRAPLAAMRAELEVSLRHSQLDDETRGLLTSTREEVVRMGRIVDNLLTLARVDQGQLELLVASHDLLQIATDGVRPYLVAAANAGVAITVDGEPAIVTGDRDRLDQVLGNLVDNAVRVAPPASDVRVTVGSRDGEATLSVSDAGPGVPEATREHIFERFTRGDPTRARTGGAGLGLAICHEIVRAHGGHIRVEDNDQGGATFVVTLPTADTEHAPELGTPSQTQPGRSLEPA